MVFEISPSHVKTFHYPPQHFNNHQVLPAAVRRLCVGSAESKDQQVSRPHHVQVQGPISRTILRNYKSFIFATVFQRVFASLVLPGAVLAFSASLVSSVTSRLVNRDSTTAWNSYDSQDLGRAFTDIGRQRTLTFFRRQQAEADGRRSSQLDCLNSALSDLVSRGLFINDYA